LPNLDCGAPPEWRQWLESLDRIERLNPYAIVPGHGPVAIEDDVARVFEAVRRELELAVATGRSPTSV
jgi:glyoxylase-like metal-dependent hydrolase (beta-lactamase superfamily II)